MKSKSESQIKGMAGAEKTMTNYLARLSVSKPGQMRVDLMSFRWHKQNKTIFLPKKLGQLIRKNTLM